MTKSTRTQTIRATLFAGRWLLLPFYFCLVIGQAVYCCKFIGQVWELCRHFTEMDENKIMLAILSMIDVTMIAALITMVIRGGFNSIVDLDGEHDKSFALKVKMACSLIAVSSIHLIQVFIDSAHINWDELQKKCIIHVMFILGALALAFIDYLHTKTEGYATKSY